MPKWTVVDTKIAYQSKYMSVFNDTIKLPNKSIISYARVKLKDFCSVLPITENKKIVMIEIYRYPVNYISLEIPSGYVKQGEKPRDCALRELEEETGYKARRLTSFGWFYPWTRSTRRAHLFIAKNLTEGRQKTEPTEQIKIKLLSIEEARNKLETGKIKHAPTIIALQKFLLTRARAL